MSIRSIPAAVCALALLGLTGLRPVHGQSMHTLTIQDGRVLVDGEVVPADELPASLDLRGLDARYSFTGNVRPLIPLNGTVYTLEENRVVEAAPFEDGAPRAVGVRDRPHLRGVDRRGDHEVQRYLQRVEQQNRALFRRLVTEREMEAETRRLAREVHAAPRGAEREARIRTLRGRLDAIFELKQENRRRQIHQLDAQLARLRSRLQEREQHRDAIIEQRLEHLLEESMP